MARPAAALPCWAGRCCDRARRFLLWPGRGADGVALPVDPRHNSDSQSFDLWYVQGQESQSDFKKCFQFQSGSKSVLIVIFMQEQRVVRDRVVGTVLLSALLPSLCCVSKKDGNGS